VKILRYEDFELGATSVGFEIGDDLVYFRERGPNTEPGIRFVFAVGFPSLSTAHAPLTT
jgi:hypothetical protein